jgi:hypothetical protein
LEAHHLGANNVLLKAEERVILGYLEIKALSAVLLSILETLAMGKDKSST